MPGNLRSCNGSAVKPIMLSFYISFKFFYFSDKAGKPGIDIGNHCLIKVINY